MQQAVRLSRSSFREMYWTFAQMLAHHTSNGCPMRSGDLLASGTVSGPEKENRGCLLELTWKGLEPLALPNGEQRTFLEDGDEVILTGYCRREGFVSIGLGAASELLWRCSKRVIQRACGSGYLVHSEIGKNCGDVVLRFSRICVFERIGAGSCGVSTVCACIICGENKAQIAIVAVQKLL